MESSLTLDTPPREPLLSHISWMPILTLFNKILARGGVLPAAGRDAETPWLLWDKACERLIAAWPGFPRHPRGIERIADGCTNHSLDAVRYGVQ